MVWGFIFCFDWAPHCLAEFELRIVAGKHVTASWSKPCVVMLSGPLIVLQINGGRALTVTPNFPINSGGN